MKKTCFCWKFIRTLKNKIYKYITSISRNVYIDKLDNVNDKYNNTCKIIKLIEVWLVILQIVKKFFFLNKSEIVYCGHVLSVILRVKKLLVCFMKRNWKDKSEIFFFRNEKVKRKKRGKFGSFHSWNDKSCHDIKWGNIFL